MQDEIKWRELFVFEKDEHAAQVMQVYADSGWTVDLTTRRARIGRKEVMAKVYSENTDAIVRGARFDLIYCHTQVSDATIEIFKQATHALGGAVFIGPEKIN